MALETGLEGKPWYFGAVVGQLAAGVLTYLGYTLQIKEMWLSQEEQRETLNTLEDKIVRGEAAKARLPLFRQEVGVLEEELQKLVQILPQRRDVPDVLRRFRALAEQGDFVLNRFAPGIEIEKDFYNEWPISVEVQGTYHNLASFFDRMSRFSRIFNVDNLKIDNKRQGQHSVSASFVAKTFYYTTVDEESGREEGL